MTASGVSVKICGLSEAETAHVAAGAGARWLGFVHFAPSPRHLDLAAARALAPDLPAKGPERVGVFAGADTGTMAAFADILSLDWVQLHGAETPDDIAALRDRLGLKVMKAISVGGPADIAAAAAYVGAADMILFDAKPPKDSVLPGGNAVSFPWGLMRGHDSALPWLLAGGLTAATVSQALADSGANALDVSSGVETAPGVKSASKIRAFLMAAKAAKQGA